MQPILDIKVLWKKRVATAGPPHFLFTSFSTNYLSNSIHASHKLSQPMGSLNYSRIQKPNMMINTNSTCHFPSSLMISAEDFLFYIIKCETRITIKNNVTQNSRQNRLVLCRQKLYRIILRDPGIHCSKPSASVRRIQCCTRKCRCLV